MSCPRCVNNSTVTGSFLEVIGNNNHIFGDNNMVTGNNNHIVGNNNVVKSGDNNSLVGFNNVVKSGRNNNGDDRHGEAASVLSDAIQRNISCADVHVNWNVHATAWPDHVTNNIPIGNKHGALGGYSLTSASASPSRDSVTWRSCKRRVMQAIPVIACAVAVMAAYKAGKMMGWIAGASFGYDVGLSTGCTEGFDIGFSQGHVRGYDTGFNAGVTAPASLAALAAVSSPPLVPGPSSL